MREGHQAAIGVVIARLREQQGWSQRALAKWVGLDQSAVSRVEAGTRAVSAAELQRFAAAFQVSADALLSGDAVAPEKESSPSPSSRILAAMARDQGDSSLQAAWHRAKGGSVPAPAALRTRALRAAGAGWAPPDDASVEHASGAADTLEAVAVDDRVQHFAFAPDWRRTGQALSRPPGGRRPASVAPGALPPEVTAVVGSWFSLRGLADASQAEQPWTVIHSAEGQPAHVPLPDLTLTAGRSPGAVPADRLARFWRSELNVEPEGGPLPDLVTLLEDGYGAQVIVARIAASSVSRRRRVAAPSPVSASERAAEHPVAATFSDDGVPFLFVNAGRPVVLQRYALAHAFGHLVLGHGTVVDQRIEWNRNAPPEAAANDFAEEFLAPVRAVARWYEHRPEIGAPELDSLLELGNAFGISASAALYRSRAAGMVQGRLLQTLRAQLQRREWEVLPHQAYLGGLRDTLSRLTPDEAPPPGSYGEPAVLRVPARMRAWALAAVRARRLSLDDAAATLCLDRSELAEAFARLGLD